MLLLLGACGLSEAQEKPAQAYPGITRPSEERALNFNFAGVVRKVHVKEGDHVKAGAPLLSLDDRMDRKALEEAEVESNSTRKIDYARYELEQKKVDLKRKEALLAQNAASPTEIEEAQLAKELAATRLELSVDETTQKKLEADRLRIKIEMMHLASTIDGVVQKIGVKEGEIADPQQINRPACMVVRNDPLKVEVFLPAALAAKLRVQDAMDVQYGDSDEWLKAKVTFLDPVADAASEMRKLHLELPNPSQRESGLQVKVRVPAK
jgi:RND family efflux transporter MFP subunit